MRKFLYITPYFPPQSQVGALRPLKFVRHLPAQGWLPVVLCDLWPSDGMDPELEAFVPADIPVHYNYSHRATPTLQALHAGTLTKPRVGTTMARTQPLHERILPKWLQQPELMPLGEHSPDMPWAYRAALDILKAQPDIEAIVVNADPFAACLVGAALHQKTGLPLIQDLRDPWAPCEMRRPKRLPPQRWLEDKLERYAVQNAAHVVLNTQATLDDYRAFYRDLPRAKFSMIRNFCDTELVSHGAHPGYDRFTLLHLGSFTRFRTATPLVQAMARAIALGVPAEQIQAVSTGAWDDEAMAVATHLGVRDLFRSEAAVPYHKVGAICQAADMLVFIAEATTQRIASKFYDYVGARRPVLGISDNAESAELLELCGAGKQLATHDIEATAQYIRHVFAGGRQQVMGRPLPGLMANEAAANLVRILDQVTEQKR